MYGIGAYLGPHAQQYIGLPNCLISGDGIAAFSQGAGGCGPTDKIKLCGVVVWAEPIN